MFKKSIIFFIFYINISVILSYEIISISGDDFNDLNSIDDFLPDKLESYFNLKKPIDPEILEDSLLQVPELIKKYGRPSEVHKVETVDGYILTMHRMPRPGAKPVFLMHGLLDSSSTWVMMGPDRGFAYMLYDLGYDVWMGNARGNHYSREHRSISPDKSKFWQFSFHEIGVYDLPAMIDYVLKNTTREKLQYIGHSQGTITFWIMCSEKPEYASKIISMNALAPVAYVSHIRSPIVQVITFLMKNFARLISWIGPDEFLPNSDFLAMVSRVFCKDGALTQDICSNIIFAICGYNEHQMNKTMMPVMIGHTPAGASTKQIIHFSQLNRSGKFRQYDYGYIQNFMKYGSLNPPEYRLENVRTKVALHYSTNDWLADPRDIEKLHQNLPMRIGKFLVDDVDFSHLDFVWGIDARPYCYERVVTLMKLVEDGIL
ncbi:lipase 3-like [Condylostylus longicornis]|uniref:lipase 3-like n=1 Tax=Condylostylus longicornis TaxID=2530218 RepID=UPI00244DAE74|nr:lipase 3-like [Condylostylus longicornis]